MGSVISQSLNIKTKIVCDLSASGEQDSVSSASVSPLWPEVTNYSVISHLSCLSFLNRMSIYTTLNNSLYLLLWIAHAGEDPLDGQSGQTLQYEGELDVVRGPGEQLHHQPVGLLHTEKIVTRTAAATYPNPLLATLSQVEVARSAAASPHDPWRPHHNCPQQVLFSSQPPSPCRAVGRGAGQGREK